MSASPLLTPAQDDVTARLLALGLDWPRHSDEATEFTSVVQDGSALWVSGQIPESADGLQTGKVGSDLSVEEAALAARLCALNLLAAVRSHLAGDLSRIRQIANLRVYVNAADGFEDFSKVADGASEFLKTVLGARGAHTRSTIGVSGLYANIPVEADAVFLIEDRETPTC